MPYSVDTLMNCICCAFVAAAIPLIIFEVIADLKERREEKDDAYFSNGKWHQK